jgi:hypothetical protein
MATNPAHEVVRPETVVGSELEVRRWLRHAEARGVLRGNAFTITRLRDGRVAIKVHVAGGHHDRGKPTVLNTPPRRWSPANRQLVIAAVGVTLAAFVATVLWLIVRTVLALSAWTADHAGPIVGGISILIVLALIAGSGGGGRGTFSGTFKGTWR